VASDPVVSRLISRLAGDLPAALRAIWGGAGGVAASQPVTDVMNCRTSTSENRR
jgi:hypothetical protein